MDSRKLQISFKAKDDYLNLLQHENEIRMKCRSFFSHKLRFTHKKDVIVI